MGKDEWGAVDMPNEFEKWLNGGTTGQDAVQAQANEVKPDGDAFLNWLNGGQTSAQGQGAPDTSGAAQPAAPISANPLLPGNIENNGLGPATVLADEDVSSDVLPGTGGFVLVPSTDDAGNALTKEQMVERYRADGRNYGTFDTRESAIAYQAEHSNEETRALVRAQLLQAKGISLEQQARDREVARRLGLPPTVISYQREWAEDENTALLFEQYQELMEFAAKSPENAAIAKGDMDVLGQIASLRENNARVAQWARTHRLVGPEGEATVGDQWRRGDLARQQSMLGYQYAFENANTVGEIERVDREEMLPLSQKVVLQGTAQKLLGMGIESLPSQLQMFARGALDAAVAGATTAAMAGATGAAAGTVLGPGGSAAGFLGNVAANLGLVGSAMTAGYLAGNASEAFKLEAGNMAVTLLREKDADGKTMPREVIKAASTIYGFTSAALETVGEGLFLRVLKPLGLDVAALAGKESIRGALKNAIVNAVKDKSLLAAIMDIGSRLSIGALQEGATESLQEVAAIFTESNAKLQSNMGEAKTKFDANLPDNFWERVGESFVGGAVGGGMLHSVPIIASSAMRAMSAHAAANFANQQNELHAVVEQAALKQKDPELFEQKLTELNPAMGEQVTVPMDEAVKLYQSGVDILTPLGVSLEAAQVDAAAGQSLTVSLASLHARLDQSQFEAASQIMHRSPEAESAQDVQTISEDTVRAFQDMIDNAQENQAAANGTRFMTQEQREEFDNSFTSWQGQIRESVLNNPKLLSQLGSKRNVDRFVNSNAELMRKRALLEARRTGRAPADMLQRVFLRNSARWRAWEAGRRGDTEAQIAAELDAQAIENERAASLQRKARRAQRSDSYQGVRDVTMQAPTEVEFSGENVWRPANRPEYTPEQLSARRAQSTLDPEDQANWLETPRGRYGIRYEVWELADLLPSHDPFNQFQRAPEYPSIAQERAYHRVRSEQDKVRRNAVHLNPRYLVTDSPDASSGPPVVTTDGIVLGGNSRTMSMQLAFTKPEKLQEYKDYLASRSQLYGIEPETFSGMQAPVLVRVLQGGMNPDEMAIASNAFNQVQTEELNVVGEGVSKSRRIDNRILTEIGSALENFDTLREYMGSRESRDLVQMLIEKEIIAPNQVGRMVTKDGMLTSTGKDLLESALRGLIIQDYDILANASENVASVLNKIDRAILSLVRLKRIGGKWDLSKIVAKALQQIYRADASTPNFRLADLPGYFASGDLGGVDPDRGLRSVQAIALTLANSQTSVREAAARFNVMASIAEQERSSASMGSLVPREPVTPEQAFIQAFLSPVATVDNKPVLNFRPEKNTRHAAMQWTSNASSLPDATSKLEQLAVDDKLSEDERNMYKEYGQELAKLGAEKVAVYQPKVGEFFSYNPDTDQLWQTAYHGSPFRFDSFSTEHIGEGEGAQVHGWGLYFTKNKKIGEKYRKALKQMSEQGQLFSVDIPENNVLLDEQKTFDKQNKNVKDLLYKAIESFSSNEEDRFYEKLLEEKFDDNTELENARKELDRLSTQQKSFLIAMSPKGPSFLASRANLKLQGFSDEQIQQFINNPEMGIEEAKKLTPVVRAVQEKVDALATQDRERRAAIIQEAKEDFGKTLENVTGRKLYAAIAYALSDNSYKYESKEASLWLNKHGIKGITYMGDTDGRCFVVFDDKAVEVLRTFYQDQAITYPNNGKPVGQISPEIAQTLHLNKPGTIVLDDIGLQHIEKRHSKEIHALGFANARDFVLSTLANVSAVYDVDGKGRKYDLVSRSMDRQRRVMVRLEFSETGDYYSVVTAGPLRDGFFNNKTPLWERAPSNHSTKGTPDAISGQSGVLQQSAAGGINLTSTQQGVNQNPSVNDVLDQAEELHRGGVTSTQGNYIIDLFQTADLSTLLHEMGHVWFMELERAVREGYADETMRADFEKLCKWVGGLQNMGGLTGRLTIEQHEQLARGLEAYFLEGKAPSEELRGVFANFRKWLKRIYQTVANLGVKLNDEVRGVFDRMFATQEEIEEVAATNGFVNLSTGELDILGVPKSQQEYTRMVLEAAKEKAVERLQTRRDTERRNRMREYYKRARKEVSKRPVYRAMRDMRETPLDATAVRNMLGDETLAALQAKGITFTELGGQDPTVFAARHKFDSVEAMATELLQAGDIRQETRRRMQEMSDEYDTQFDALDELLDSNELVEHASLVARHLAKVGSRPYIHQSAINQVVDNLSANKTVSELMRMSTFLGNMRSALRKERLAIAQGEFLSAIEANTQARLNLEMARRAKNLRDRTEKLPRRVRRALGTKVIPEVVKYGLMTVASNHGVVPLNQALASKYSPQDFNAWLKGVKDNGFDLLLDEGILVTFNTWQQMRLEQFEDLENTLNQIITLERNQRKLLTSQRKESLDEAADNIAKSVMAHGELHEVDTVNGERRILSKLKRFHVAHMKVEELCIEMDGGVVGGPVWTHIYKPIADAENKQVLRLKEVRNYIKNELFGRYYSKSELVEMGSKRKKVLVPEINKVMNKEQRLAVALNMGNETNIDRLRSGFEWTDEQIRAVVSTLDERDWQFVQAVWDYFDTFRPESFDMEERLTGARPRAVIPQPLNVPLPDGRVLNLRGGYYPIKYNPAKNSNVFARHQEELDKELMGGRNYSYAMTRHGHLKERTKGGERDAPLLLSLSVIPEHLYNTVHDLCYRPAVIDVNRVIRHDKVREAIESYAGREIYQALRPWLVDCANESTVQQSDIYALANWARASMSIGSMGFKVTTILTQMAGLTTTVDVLGAKWTARGFARVLLRNPSKMAALWEETKMRSPFMSGRLESFDRDMRDTAKRIQQSRAENVLQTVRETAFKPMAYMQLWSVDMPTWWGAYEKGLQDFHGDEAMAVDFADSMVRQTQGSGSTKDLSSIQRGNDLQRLFTMFYSFFSVLYNLGARHIKELRADHSPAGIWRASVHALLLWFLPVMLSEFLAGRWGGDDEDEDTLVWLTKLWLAYPLQSIIGVRDIVNATSSGFGYQLSPASAPPEAIVKAMRSIGKAIEEEDPSVLVKPTAQAIAYGFMLPGGQASITLENLYDYFSDPDSEFYVRDLFFRKPVERRD